MFSRCEMYFIKSHYSSLYCSTLLQDGSKTGLKNLRIAYNNSVHKLLGIPRFNSTTEMFVCLNNPYFNELLRKYVFSLRSRLLVFNLKFVYMMETFKTHSLHFVSNR